MLSLENSHNNRYMKLASVVMFFIILHGVGKRVRTSDLRCHKPTL